MNEIKTDRQEFYDRIGAHNMAPLWEVLHGLVTREPVSPVQPTVWHYDELRPFIMEAGKLITAREAERRVLILENPGMRGQSQITRSLYAGLQLILPGEVAPAHRHTQSALRFVIEGQGAFTAVNGERTVMSPGDFVITPSWTWHDHGNDSDAPMVWLDGLDIPLITMLDASFAEPANAEQQLVSRPEGDALKRFGNALFPVDWESQGRASPIFNYPYVRSRETLEAVRRAEGPDPAQGWKLRYVNPANGDFAMPTIGTFLQLLPAGFATNPYRSSDATVFVVVEGGGETRIDDVVLPWRAHDVFVVPSWASHTHHAGPEAVLFSFSDRPVQQKLGLWREQRTA